ncbi:phosphatidylcholine and lysophosphatidylcholine phospholipase [Thecaphora frezii]
MADPSLPSTPAGTAFSLAAAATAATGDGSSAGVPLDVHAGRNPVMTLFEGILGVVLASLNLIKVLITFATITIPSAVYTVLHYSLTLQLNFPSLALLFLGFLIAGSLWLRYRYFNRYERLREVPIIKDEGFNLHPDVASAGGDGDHGSFHNYLDDFLQAIRIFGFLEKPVFHELARHLQTRRLVAGDSLSLDSDFSFYIVIDGHVQVYAPLPPGTVAAQEADAFDDEELSGYQLLNEVESGGTLSSLFTILSLFTEDIKLGFGDEAGRRAAKVGISRTSVPNAGASRGGSVEMDRSASASQSRRSTQSHPLRGGDVTSPSMMPTSPRSVPFHPQSHGAQHQLNAAALRHVPSALGPEAPADQPASAAPTETVAGGARSHRTNSSAGSVTVAGNTSTVVGSDHGSDQIGALGPAPDLQMPPAQATAPFPHFAPSNGVATPGTPRSTSGGALHMSPHFRARQSSVFPLHDSHPATPGSIFSGMGSVPEASARQGQAVPREGAGTVARATVDTTLAVIPAEAFKRLTKKFPNAAAHIVQVILARLSRVTFHTAHKYLGLTKEVMRTEKAINELACFPLPSEFYEKGGMEKLRHRFLPEPKKKRGEPSEDDYFRNFEDWPQRTTTRTPKPSSPTSSRKLARFDEAPSVNGAGQDPPPTATAENGSFWQQRPSKTPWGHPDPPPRTPLPRLAVEPGDLLTMTEAGDEGWRLSSTPLHSGQPTPRNKPRLATRIDPIVEHPSTSPTSPAGFYNKMRRSSGPLGLDEDSLLSAISPADFDLKMEVMDCIAKSIGLAQAAPSPMTSYQASPHISAQDALLQRSVFKSAFSSLSMLDAAMGADEESVTGTASSVAGGHPNAFHHTDFENEIEIKFFSAGETLAKAGETDAGLFFVIDGFLDILLPKQDGLQDDSDSEDERPSKQRSQAASRVGQEQGNGEDSSVDYPQLRRRPNAIGRAAAMEKADSEDGRVKTTDPSEAERFNIDLAGSRASRASFTSSERKRTSRDLSQSFNRAQSNFGTLKLPLESDKIGNALDGTAGRSSQRKPRPLVAGQDSQRLTPGTNRAGSRSSSHRSNKHRDRDGPSPRGKGREPRGPDQPKALFTVGRGGIAGYLSSLLGAASYVDIKAKTDVYIGFLPAHALERMMEKKPIVLLTLCKRLLSLLSPLILHIDSSLDWQQVNAGQIIYREGDRADSLYIVINGRLRAIAEREDGGAGVEVLSEYGQGDSVGELDVITNSRRRKTLHAIRDTELAKMPSTLFNAISVRHPAITIQISRIIARRVRTELRQSQRSAARMNAPVPGLPDLGRNNSNLKTVAIVPVTRQVPVRDFAARLQAAFEDTIGGPTAFLNQSSVMGVLGRHAFSRMGKLKLAGWLADQEQKYRLVLYVVDTPVSSAWSQTSIRQADCVLLVGFGDDPTVGEYERLLLSLKTTARKELVLLHPERSVPPGSTREWLKSRPWIHAHFHVEMPGITRTHGSPAVVDPKAVKALRNLKQKLETSIRRYKDRRNAVSPGRPHHASDFARLARRLCGKSIGLVLGGGGARGCAHLGVLKALEEKGIPIDMVGGTSIGSLVGGLYASEAELVSSIGRVKRFAGRLASLWRMASDLTYPVVSYTTGHEFNRGVFKAIQETHIEDMWLPYFCNTTNITWSRMEVHTTGYAWRYIRGSMTLAGLVPPLVDEGNMLVDGGYMDNLPVSVMMALGARHVFAVDVGSIDDTSPRSYGDTLSGWWVLLNRWNPWSDARNIPSIPDIQGRLTYVSSVKTLEDAKKIKGCFYMRMPVEGFGTLEFGKFDEISRKGYDAARTMLDEWDREGKLPRGIEKAVEMDAGRRRRKGGISARRNSI